MSAFVSENRLPLTALTGVGPSPGSIPVVSGIAGRDRDADRPGRLVLWAFFLFIFSIPFTSVYVPGTGERLGVTRIVQLLLLLAAVSQPRVCLRFVPAALLWLLAYAGLRVAAGLWLTPELSNYWWPSTLTWLQVSLPGLWVLHNVMRFSGMRQLGAWALAWGASLCALLHVLGVGVSAVDNSGEGRTSIFGQNANIIGAIYAAAMIALLGLGMLRNTRLNGRLIILPLLGVLGLAVAKTGSRTAMLILALGAGVLLFQARSFSPRLSRYLMLGMMALVLVGVVSQVPTVMRRFEMVGSGKLKEQEGRVRMAPVLWEMFLRSPIYGTGPDGYRFELPYLVREQKTISAHNLALLLLVETGLAGLAVFGAAMGGTLRAAWRARRGACGYLPLALLIPFLAAGLTVSNPLTNPVFWFVLAYALPGAAPGETFGMTHADDAA
jgi:hypothetical protein